MVERRAIDQLVEIATMLQDRDLAKLAEHQAELNKARETRQKFVEASKDENEVLQENLGYRREVESPRLVWRERQLYALSHYAARAAALVEAQRKIASKSFGRARVLESIQASVKRPRP